MSLDPIKQDRERRTAMESKKKKKKSELKKYIHDSLKNKSCRSIVLPSLGI